MKKVTLLMSVVLSAAIMLCACSNSDEEFNVTDGTVIDMGDSGLSEDSLISRDLAWEIVKSTVLKNKLDGLFFINDDTMANWSHPCRYVYVNAKGGDYEVHQHSMPPFFGEYEEDMFIILVKENWE